VEGTEIYPEHTNLKPNGQQQDYVVLAEEERAKGFVRPVRRSYVHVGTVGPANPLRDITAEEHERYDQYGYVKFEEYPPGGALGRFWTQAEIDKIGKGCRTLTTMSRAIAETYARDPKFYGGTFCCGCGAHFPVGAGGEFVWADSEERVGT